MTVVAIMAILSGITLIGFNLFLKQGKIAKSMAFDSSIHFNLGWAMVGDWKMDDNAANSTVVDTSGYDNDGTFNDSTNPNTSYHSVDGANGTALEFDGVDDGIAIPDDDSLDITDEITISAWIYPLSLGGGTAYRGIVEKKETNLYTSKGYLLNIDVNNSVRFNIGDGTTNDWVQHSISTDTWQHVVGVVSNSGVFLYIDGNLVGSDTTRETDSIGLTSSDLRIGEWDGQENFNGSIDQVRIYSEAFSLSQVKYQYYTGLQRLYDKGLMSGKEYKSRIVKLNSES